VIITKSGDNHSVEEKCRTAKDYVMCHAYHESQQNSFVLQYLHSQFFSLNGELGDIFIMDTRKNYENAKINIEVPKHQLVASC